jgi:uncharacterized protein (TIGR03435 family)
MRTLAAIAILAASSLHAQPGPAFTVVSVKLNPDPPNISGIHQITQGDIHFVHVALQRLILDAFRIQDYQVASTTSLTKGRWDVEATMPADSSPDQIAAMMRTMLEDRFGLQAHTEKRPIPVYVLTSVDASKLKPTTDPSGRLSAGGGTTSATQIEIGGRGTMSGLASLLNNIRIGRPVLDKTGLSGRYQIDIVYSPNIDLQNGAGQDDLSAPSIFTALKDKLGLKLEPRNEEFDCLVVDRVNQTATPNQ